MSLNEILNIKKGDVIAIIGSGGKTTLAYNLAKENTRNKFLLTTTTKMKKSNYEYINYFYDKLCDELPDGVSFFGKSIEDNKISAICENDLQRLIKQCDICVYEADGSKEKPLKAWNSDEPVILQNTNKCIGVMPLFLLGKKLNEDLVHRFSIFENTFKTTYFDNELAIKICREMFKKIDKNIEKYIYFNRVSDELALKNIANNLSDFKIFASLKDSYERINF